MAASSKGRGSRGNMQQACFFASCGRSLEALSFELHSVQLWLRHGPASWLLIFRTHTPLLHQQDASKSSHASAQLLGCLGRKVQLGSFVCQLSPEAVTCSPLLRQLSFDLLQLECQGFVLSFQHLDTKGGSAVAVVADRVLVVNVLGLQAFQAAQLLVWT